MDIPPIKCCTYVFARINALIAPMHKTLDIISVPVKSNAKTINKVRDINGCIKSSDKNIWNV